MAKRRIRKTPTQMEIAEKKKDEFLKQRRTTKNAGHFVKGDPRMNRRGGAARKISKKMLDKIAKEQATAACVSTPLDFMMYKLMHGTNKEKMWAARFAAPYIHKKMPIAIEGGDTPIGFMDMTKLSSLTDDELGTLMNILQRMGALPNPIGTTIQGIASAVAIGESEKDDE